MAGSSGVMTLLFTDLVGSTELLQRLGDDAAEELRHVHFSLVRRALSAAGAPGEELYLRVGIHAGEPIEDEGDFHGTAVVVARRLCDAAPGGQILASELVAGLIGSRGGIHFRPKASVDKPTNLYFFLAVHPEEH